jgi:platelet-activating factor acetylhydrolase
MCTYCSAFLTDTIPASLDAPPLLLNNVADNSKQRLPVVVVSHGLAGSRNMYAALCTSLASQGYVVAAIEHRDGSASCAALVKSSGSGRSRVTYKPYVHTDGNFKWRREQIAKRTEEFSAAIAALTAAGDGRGAPRNIFPTSRFDASALDGAVDVSQLVGLGHSFGGVTVVAAAEANKAITRIVLLDPWTAPMGDAVQATSVPTLVVNSHKWGQNLRPLYTNATAVWLEAEVAGVLHQDFSDMPLRIPWIMAKSIGKGTVDLFRLFDFKLSLMHLFFEEVAHAEQSGVGGDTLAAALHAGTVELVDRYRGEMGIQIKSSFSEANIKTGDLAARSMS